MARRAIPILLTLALSATLHAQSDPTQSAVPGAGFDAPPSTAGQSSTPTIRVFSRETILDVLVTDDQGHPVRGLTRADFTVLEDNHPLPIRGFSETSTPAPTPPPALPPNAYTNAATLPANGPIQIILLDRLGTSAEDMERSKHYVADYLRSMPQGTQAVVFEFSPIKEFTLVHDMTTDGKSAAAAVDNLDDEWLHDPVYGVPIAVAGMHHIAEYVAAVHGRKNLIWVVPRMPLPITRDGGLSWGILNMTLVHKFMDLYDIFTREQIAIYPVDPRGVHTFGNSPQEQRLELLRETVADDTGGSTSNSNDYQGTIANIVDSTAHGYTLTYVPPRPAEDGHFHSIKVMVDRPGVHLSYRTGYNDEQPFPSDPAIIHDMIQGPMRLGALPATQLIFTLQVTPAASSAAPLPVNITDKHHLGSAKDHPYNAVFTFDPTQIAFSETPDGKRTAKLEFDLGVFDSFSQLGPVRSQVITLNVNPSGYDDFMRKPFHFTLPIPIPPGQQTLRAGLFDTVAGKSGTFQVPLTIPKK